MCVYSCYVLSSLRAVASRNSMLIDSKAKVTQKVEDMLRLQFGGLLDEPLIEGFMFMHPKSTLMGCANRGGVCRRTVPAYAAIPGGVVLTLLDLNSFQESKNPYDSCQQDGKLLSTVFLLTAQHHTRYKAPKGGYPQIGSNTVSDVVTDKNRWQMPAGFAQQHSNELGTKLKDHLHVLKTKKQGEATMSLTVVLINDMIQTIVQASCTNAVPEEEGENVDADDQGADSDEKQEEEEEVDEKESDDKSDDSQEEEADDSQEEEEEEQDMGGEEDRKLRDEEQERDSRSIIDVSSDEEGEDEGETVDESSDNGDPDSDLPVPFSRPRRDRKRTARYI